MSVDANGVTLLDTTDGLISNGYPEIEFHDGLVYVSNGPIIDPTTTPPRLADTLSPPQWANNVAIDPKAEVVYYASDFDDLITGWSTTTRDRVGEWTVTGMSSVRKLRALGGGRLAYRDSGHPLSSGRLTLVSTSSSLEPGTPPPPSDPKAFGEYTAVAPARILDTRKGIGRAGTAPLAPGRTIDVQITGRAGIPATGVQAVVMNVTAVAPTQAGYFKIYPAGIAEPANSNLNFVAGRTVPNLVTVKVGSGGRVRLFSPFGNVHAVFDVAGYYATQDGRRGARLHPITPVRIADTRTGTGGVARRPIGPGGVLRLDVTARREVPDTGTTAVVLNVTAAGATSPSYLTLYPAGTARPTASNLNLVPGGPVANQVVVKVPASGKVDIYNFAGSTNVIVDLMGYYDTDRSTEAGRFVAIDPVRYVDTRTDPVFPPTGKMSPNATLYSADEVKTFSAVVLNVTVAGTVGAGYVTAFPWPGSPPATSSVNYGSGQKVANHVTVAGRPAVAFANVGGWTHLIVDVYGYFT